MDEARQEDKAVNREGKQLVKIVQSVERIIKDGKASEYEIDILREELAQLKQIQQPKA
jgi:hypothetical protein